MGVAGTKLTSKLSDDFLLQVALGNVPGHSIDFVVGYQGDLDATDGNITLWDNKFDYTPFTADTEMFISSSNTGDTSVVRVIGLDTNFDRIFLDATLSGQTQVSLGNFRHVQQAVVISGGTPAGDVYIAATDTLTAGVPDTNSKVKSKILQGKNITHNSFSMVPRGFVHVPVAIRASTDATTKTVLVETWITTAVGGLAANTVTYTVLSGFPQFIFPLPVASISTAGETQIVFPEKAFTEYKVLASIPDTQIFFGVDILVIESALTNLATG